jgi:hypothetical protein
VEDCDYSKDVGPALNTHCLTHHLKFKHPELYEKRQSHYADKKKNLVNMSSPVKKHKKKRKSTSDEVADESGSGAELALEEETQFAIEEDVDSIQEDLEQIMALGSDPVMQALQSSL